MFVLFKNDTIDILEKQELSKDESFVCKNQLLKEFLMINI